MHVHAPCYILGDLHGNYQDLIAFEKALWRIGLALNPANFVFLGDYVDRGPHSLEVITYLLAQKALCPGKISLLRGNHEIRVQNSHEGYNPCFKQSCQATLGAELGAQVWESINQAFDAFPIAAIVDNSIFCVHGGIPAPAVLGVPAKPGLAEGGSAALAAEINKIPRDLPNPDPAEGGNALAWDLMWNDPAPNDPAPSPGASGQGGCADTRRAEAAEGAEDGFADNQARGTAHVFAARGLERFLRRYGLSHLIRAHERKKTGFQVQQHSQMMTIFSSSGYCGANNEACCILACQGKIRFIRLEHSLLPQLGSLASKAAAAFRGTADTPAADAADTALMRGAAASHGAADAEPLPGAEGSARADEAGDAGQDDGRAGSNAEDSVDRDAAAALAAAAMANNQHQHRNSSVMSANASVQLTHDLVTCACSPRGDMSLSSVSSAVNQLCILSVTHASTNMHTHTHTYIYRQTDIHTYIHTNEHTHTHTHTHVAQYI